MASPFDTLPNCSVSDDSDVFYSTNCSPHGICLIISNSHFTECDDRAGTDADVKNISDTFEKLGYTIHVLTDLPYCEFQGLFFFRLYFLHFLSYII